MIVPIDDVKFDASGLIPAIVQDECSGRVLMLAYMNRESLKRTIDEGETWFWSRSRSELWHKGATSGNTQRVIDIRLDCDADALVITVEPAGPACHTGASSCFFNQLERWQEKQRDHAPGLLEREEDGNLGRLLVRLYDLVAERKRRRPEGSYTTYLFNEGLDKILKKVGEESAETIIAAKNNDPGSLVAETSDLLYHLIVLLVERGVSLDAIRAELAQRAGKPKSK